MQTIKIFNGVIKILIQFLHSGYRYELYCASKASKSTQCTVYTIRNHDEAWEDNLKRESGEDGSSVPYTEEVFNALSRLR